MLFNLKDKQNTLYNWGNYKVSQQKHCCKKPKQGHHWARARNDLYMYIVQTLPMNKIKYRYLILNLESHWGIFIGGINCTYQLMCNDTGARINTVPGISTVISGLKMTPGSHVYFIPFFKQKTIFKKSFVFGTMYCNPHFQKWVSGKCTCIVVYINGSNRTAEVLKIKVKRIFKKSEELFQFK